MEPFDPTMVAAEPADPSMAPAPAPEELAQAPIDPDANPFPFPIEEAQPPVERPGAKEVAELYKLAKSSVEARQLLDAAIAGNRPQEYHRILRTRPEVLYKAPLLAIRRQLGDLAAERSKVTRGLETGQITDAIAQVATGSLMWIKEQMAGFGDKAKQDVTRDGI